jgi:hypothetical protein
MQTSKSPVTSYQEVPRGQQPLLDDATVRDCMKAKGYKIETEARRITPALLS